MQDQKAEQADLPLSEKLHLVVDEMLAPYGKSSPRGNALLAPGIAPFDYSKSNLHDSKAEYLAEREVVEKSCECINEALMLLLGGEGDDDYESMLTSLRLELDRKARVHAGRRDIETAHSLVRSNASTIGISIAYMALSFDMITILKERLAELDDQRDRFWNLSHRAPDYHAREIALRLAQLFARETGQKPTIGTSPIDGDPSTAYTKALAQTFDLLGIPTNPRSPAEWAVSQLTENDLSPPRNALFDQSALSALPHDSEHLSAFSLLRGEKGRAS